MVRKSWPRALAFVFVGAPRSATPALAGRRHPRRPDRPPRRRQQRAGGRSSAASSSARAAAIRASSAPGNYGLMQIKPATARGMGYSGSAAGLLDADTNMTYAVKYLAGAWRVARGNADLAVHYYAAGYYYAAKGKGLFNRDGSATSALASADRQPASRCIAAKRDRSGARRPGLLIRGAAPQQVDLSRPAHRRPLLGRARRSAVRPTSSRRSRSASRRSAFRCPKRPANRRGRPPAAAPISRW